MWSIRSNRSQVWHIWQTWVGVLLQQYHWIGSIHSNGGKLFWIWVQEAFLIFNTSLSKSRISLWYCLPNREIGNCNQNWHSTYNQCQQQLDWWWENLLKLILLNLIAECSRNTQNLWYRWPLWKKQPSTPLFWMVTMKEGAYLWNICSTSEINKKWSQKA